MNDYPITALIEDLKDGQSQAAQQLWDIYFDRMVNLANNKLIHTPRARRDEEDIALSAFNSFCTGLQNNQFPKLKDRDTLWPLLVAITTYKAVDHIRHENRAKRGNQYAHTQIYEQAIAALTHQSDPQLILIFQEQIEQLLNSLDNIKDPKLKQIALLRLQGHDKLHIAQQLGCVTRTIERKLQLIQQCWLESTHLTLD
ncbi:RNA polymerase sigma factor SigX [Poriferisphaera corsica]|uniref:RNA polymerase sigma factor SigX n=1 Tax=Poriferisphaera corsica TaxID=2528020 RepID=A0A517YSN5_9BACT|nr:ECF-type sigma factor [Poriferisphaera corsica]QDU33247.1 RNA polymerase sigma factor SigX [Poriferisphaera corsica]